MKIIISYIIFTYFLTELNFRLVNIFFHRWTRELKLKKNTKHAFLAFFSSFFITSTMFLHFCIPLFLVQKNYTNLSYKHNFSFSPSYLTRVKKVSLWKTKNHLLTKTKESVILIMLTFLSFLSSVEHFYCTDWPKLII